MNTKRLRMAIIATCLAGGMLAGCASTGETPHNANGVVFYCDGAGGGGITNWGSGVKAGLEKAGYPGAFSEFRWETGLGVIVDEEESVAAKRKRAATLARQVADYRRQYPDGPVHLVGLSAGTAIVLYTLEALPASAQIEAVVLLSSSVSADYDLTEALQRVQGDVYVTTSPHDVVLGDLAPVFGTADRQYVGREIAGLTGFILPSDAPPATRHLYAKVIHLAWDPEDDRYGDYGGHTDTAKPEFVQHVVAPLLVGEGPRNMRVHPRGTAGTYATVAE